jgi:hypothetical protein
MEEGSMVKKHDPGDVRGLEEVFRSQELSRVSETGTSPGDNGPRGRDDGLFTNMFGDASAAGTDLKRGDEVAPDITSPPRASSTAPLEADHEEEAGSSESWKRESGRYWTIAAVSAVVALVVAGVTAGTGQHSPLHISAQGEQHGPAQTHKGAHGSGGTTTSPTAPGSLTGAVGSGVLLLGLPSTGTRESATGPGGHVTLSGAASTTGASSPPSSTSSGGSPGAGAGGAPPGLGGSDPVAPVAAGVGTTVSAVGSSITGLANQLGGAVPAAAPTASAVNGVVSTLDQAVSSTTL